MSDLREYLFNAQEITDFPIPEGKKVIVTDPCYDKNTWCRMDAELPSGDYVGFFDQDSHKYVTASGICSRKEFMENEARSCSMDFGCITPEYVYRMWGGQVPLNEIERHLSFKIHVS